MRLSNELLAEQVATLCGIAVMLVGLLWDGFGVVFATGMVVATGGISFSCIASVNEVHSELRLRDVLRSILPGIILMGVTYWVAWGYTPSLSSYLLVIGLGVLGHAAVYFLVRQWLRRHREPVVRIDDERAES